MFTIHYHIHKKHTVNKPASVPGLPLWRLKKIPNFSKQTLSIKIQANNHLITDMKINIFAGFPNLLPSAWQAATWRHHTPPPLWLKTQMPLWRDLVAVDVSSRWREDWQSATVTNSSFMVYGHFGPKTLRTKDILALCLVPKCLTFLCWRHQSAWDILDPELKDA